MSILQLLQILLFRRVFIVSGAILGCFAALIALLAITPLFEATNQTLVNVPVQIRLSGDASKAALAKFVRDETKLVTDPRTTGRVVDMLGWASDPAIAARFERLGRPGGDIRAWLGDEIADHARARIVTKSAIIQIAYRDREPQRARQIAEGLRIALIQGNVDQRVSSAAAAAATIGEQARLAHEAMVEVEQRRTDFAKRNGIVLQAGDVDMEAARLATLARSSGQPSAAAMQQYRKGNERVAAAQAQLAQMRATLGANHPQYRALEQQLASLEGDLTDKAQPTIYGTTPAEIERAYQAQKAKVLAGADKMSELDRVGLDVTVKRQNWQKLATSAAELKAAARRSETSLEAIGNTSLPTAVAFPDRLLILLGGLLAGLGLGLLAALIVESRDRRVRSVTDLEFATGVPVIGLVGKIRPASLAKFSRQSMTRSPTS
jgi:uncharacterized protein involved in exopolysaccharide biosynthesis